MGPSRHQCSLQSYKGQPRDSRKRYCLRMRILRGSTPASLSIGEIITGSNLPERFGSARRDWWWEKLLFSPVLGGQTMLTWNEIIWSQTGFEPGGAQMAHRRKPKWIDANSSRRLPQGRLRSPLP